MLTAAGIRSTPLCCFTQAHAAVARRLWSLTTQRARTGTHSSYIAGARQGSHLSGHSQRRPCSMSAAAFPSLVSVDWLSERLDDPSVRILDGSWHMPNAHATNIPCSVACADRDPVADFMTERIRGARFFALDAICDRSSPLPHMLPTEAAFAAAADALNIRNETAVVVYDTQGIFSAPRVWWTFKAFGHDRVAVLDGGYPAWAAKGLPKEIDSVPAEDIEAPGRAAQSPPTKAAYKPVLQKDMVRSADDVLRNVDEAAEQLVDARPPGRFEGSAPEPRPGMASGHVPGSVNVPFPVLLTKDGRYNDEEKLRATFREAGVDTGKPLVVSCGTGVTACVVALALEQLPEKPKVAVYDGSWTEWGARDDLPKVTGKA